MAARASPRLFTPWGTWSGWRETVTQPFVPPSTLCEPMQGLTAHEALMLPAATPSPQRDSTVVVPPTPLPWGKAMSSSEGGASTSVTRGDAGACLTTARACCLAKATWQGTHHRSSSEAAGKAAPSPCPGMAKGQKRWSLRRCRVRSQGSRQRRILHPYLATDVVGVSMDTGGFTPRLFGKWREKDAFTNSKK
jgi:hypothetical protein